MDIVGIQNMTFQDLKKEIDRGGRFVTYQFCISIIVLTFKRPSPIYFIPGGHSRITRGLPFAAVSLFAGWWGIPWGPIYTIGSLITTLGGGKDVTQAVLATLQPTTPPPLPSQSGNPRQGAALAHSPGLQAMPQKRKAHVVHALAIGIMALFPLWFGGQALYVNVTNWKPAKFTIEEYESKRPDKMWLSLTGCRLNLMEASYKSYFGAPDATEVFVPVRGENVSYKDPVIVLLGTKDEKILATMTEINKLNGEDEIKAYFIKNRDAVLFSKNVEGTVRFGADADHRTIDDLRKANPSLVQNFIIIDEGERPDWIKVVFFLAAGFALTWLAWIVFKSTRKTAATTTAIPPPLP